jgi:hypothetical protein
MKIPGDRLCEFARDGRRQALCRSASGMRSGGGENPATALPIPGPALARRAGATAKGEGEAWNQSWRGIEFSRLV